MGAAPSKKKLTRKLKKDTNELQATTSQSCLKMRSYSKTQLNALCADLDCWSAAASQMYPSESLLSSNTEPIPFSQNTSQNTSQKTGSHRNRFVNLDDHPVLTKLQNEQNARLEDMEQRISKIRTSAMQAAERQKYAYLFRAKSEESRTAKLLKKASEALDDINERKTALGDCDSDKGEIIPVRILCEKENQLSESEPESKARETCWPAPLQSMNFSEPVKWLLLPFFLPLLIVIYLIRFVGNHTDTYRLKKRQ